ncbi:MAG: LEA14-like dessication related protein [Myxococcota bacterium]|jgi:LEA14-like dessication related protein
MTHPHAFTLAALAILTAGCTDGAGGLLDVSFDRLDVQNIDFETVDADFVFRVENNTSFGLSVADFDYALQFADIEWLTGDDPEGLTLLASDYSEIALPTSVVFENLYEVVQANRGDDIIGFGLAGNFGLALATDTVTYDDDSSGQSETEQATNQGIEQGEDGTYILDIPYDAGGDFPALRRPKFSFEKIRLANLSLSTASIELDLGVDNEHESNLWFTNFDYSLGLDGTTIASGLIDDLGGVDGVASGEASAASIGTLTLPIDIDLLSLGVAGVEIYQALANNQPLNLNLAAATDVDTPFGVVTLAVDESGNVSVE